MMLHFLMHRPMPTAIRTLFAVLLALAMLALAGPAPALAEAPAGRDALSAAQTAAIPEEDDRFQVVVFGDSLADGLWTGVYRSLRRDNRFEVVRHTRVSSGLSRPDYFNWQDELDTYLARHDVDAAVISVGLNDAQPVYHDGRWEHGFGTDPWNEIYRERVGAFMGRLTEAGVPTFWIGLPTVRSSSFDERIHHINQIYREMAEAHGVIFVPTRALTADEDGEYAAYLADDSGRSRLMRANDGVHFTTRGYEMLAEQLLAAMGRNLDIFAEAGAHE
jgi:hypothetical protein